MIWGPRRLAHHARRRSCPCVRPEGAADRASPAIGLAALAVCLPLAAVLLSGWVMFHMGDDVKILAVSAVSATVAMIGGLFLAQSIAGSIDQVRDALGRAIAWRSDRPCARVRTGRGRGYGQSFNEMAANLERSSMPGVNSWPGRATICEHRSRICKRCSRRSRTASPNPTTTSLHSAIRYGA